MPFREPENPKMLTPAWATVNELADRQMSAAAAREGDRLLLRPQHGLDRLPGGVAEEAATGEEAVQATFRLGALLPRPALAGPGLRGGAGQLVLGDGVPAEDGVHGLPCLFRGNATGTQLLDEAPAAARAVAETIAD